MRAVRVLISSRSSPPRSTRYRALMGRKPMPAPRCWSSAGERSYTVTSAPTSRRTSAAVNPPSEPPATATRHPEATASRLTEGGHPLDVAHEQRASLVDRRVPQPVRRRLLRVLRPDPVELRVHTLADGRIVLGQLLADGAADADPVVGVVGVDEDQ